MLGFDSPPSHKAPFSGNPVPLRLSQLFSVSGWLLLFVEMVLLGFVIFSSAPLLFTGEGNGNPLQCSCLENPRDGGAWWAAVYGVAQSQTRLKRLSSSSSSSPALLTLFSRKSLSPMASTNVTSSSFPII